MANPTTNYSFQMPTSTDLVTDLPADFEVFGQAVDTQMKTNADAATQKATLTTKGDIYAATGTSTPARLAVGTNNQVLTVDSTTGTGLKWATPSAGSMTLLSTTSWTTASQTISSISGAYKNLEVWVVDWFSTVTDDVNLRLNGNTGTAYKTLGIGGSTTAFHQYASAGSTVIKLTNPGYSADNVDRNNFIRFRINDYTNTASKKVIDFNALYTSGGQYDYLGQGTYYATPAAIDSITLWIPTAGSPSGTIYIYGVN
jgi:hypothetical protein